MADESFQEKTERATPRRREKAREKGQVAKSMDLNAAAIICLGFTALFLMGPRMASQIMDLVRYTMTNAAEMGIANTSFTPLFTENLIRFLMIVLPFFVAMIVIGVGINVAQVGFKISSKAMEPKFEKLNVINGLKKLFSMKSAVQLVRDPLKLLVVGIVAYFAIEQEFESFFALANMSVWQLASTMGRLSMIIALKIGAAILVIAVLDYIYQRYEFEKSIKMTKQEIKDESKDTEGSPQTKARVRQIQREMSRKRMMSEVPTADVVITNPTHIAVALKYNLEEMDAPYVVAKGERRIAEKIKEIAREHGIPTYEDKPLARALFKMCEVGQMVPANLYRAVAEVIAYIYRVNGRTVS